MAGMHGMLPALHDVTFPRDAASQSASCRCPFDPDEASTPTLHTLDRFRQPRRPASGVSATSVPAPKVGEPQRQVGFRDFALHGAAGTLRLDDRRALSGRIVSVR